MQDLVFLENHTVYSLCEGTVHIADLNLYAKTRRFSYLSICDTNGFYGVVNFIQACREAGLRPLNEEPLSGALGKRIVFLHPRDTGGVLVEICAD